MADTYENDRGKEIQKASHWQRNLNVVGGHLEVFVLSFFSPVEVKQHKLNVDGIVITILKRLLNVITPGGLIVEVINHRHIGIASMTSR